MTARPLFAPTFAVLLAALPSAQESQVVRIPLAFERNLGQTDAHWTHVARAPGYAMFAARDGFTVRTSGENTSVLRFSPRDGRHGAPIEESALAGVAHYLRGSDPTAWVRDVPRCARLRWDEVYPGVDLVLRDGDGCAEYDFELARGASPDSITIDVDGGVLRLADGALQIVTAHGVVEQAPPIAYQPDGDRRIPVAARYELRGEHAFGFALGAVDPALPLVIDPVVGYATWLGGSNWDYVLDIAVDPQRNAYVVGQTASLDFPQQGGLGRAINGVYDAFVAKLDPSGSALVWSAYLGGSGAVYNQFEAVVAVAVDGAQEPVITGYTDATDFPVTANAAQPAIGGNYDAFVCRLNASGSGFVFSTYLGGSGRELWSGLSGNLAFGGDIALDGSSQAIVIGSTLSTDLPVLNAMQTSLGGYDDAYIAKYGPTGVLQTLSYFGGTGSDHAESLCLDPIGFVLVGGLTSSPDHPVTPGAFDTTLADQGYVTIFDPALSSILASTRFPSVPNAVAFASTGGDVYVAGGTRRKDFPRTPDAMVWNWPGASDTSADAEGFLTRLDFTLSTLRWSTLVGVANLGDGIVDMRVDAAGYPVLLHAGRLPGGTTQNGSRVVRMAPDGRAWCSEQVLAIGSHALAGLAIDSTGSAWMAGGASSASAITPTPGAYQPIKSALSDGFVVRVDDAFSGLAYLGLGVTRARRGTSHTATITVDGPAPASGVLVVLSATPNGSATVPATVFIPPGSLHAAFPITVARTAPDGTVTVQATSSVGSETATFQVWAGPTYALRVIGTAPYSSVTVSDINDDGIAVGNVGGAFFHSDYAGFQRVLAANDVTAISPSGLITGGINYEEVYLVPYTGVPQSRFTSSTAAGVNDLGQVVGTTTRYSTLGYGRAYVWTQSGGMVNLGTLLGGSASYGYAINGRGVVVGDSFVASAGRRAFVWQAGTAMRDLGVLSGHAWSTAYDINEHGQICGISADTGFSAPHAFRVDGSTMVDLGALPGDVHSLAFGINDHGQSVGFSARRGAVGKRAVLHTPTRGMQELAAMIEPADVLGWTLEEARAINDHGQIVGTGRSADGTTAVAFRLDPVATVRYGQGCPGGNGRTPILAGEGRPAAGETFALVVGDGAAGASSILLLGTAAAQTPILGACNLLVQSPLSAGFALAADGRARLTFALPPSLAAGSLFVQVVCADPAAPSGAISASNGLEVRIL
ncbi:MAG: hypothetical protein HZB39_09585 [Planctomycetes bacterium]|nr:hypothetical protein [Planctomycetota bacterium]